MLTWQNTDKSKWQRGPWDAEPDKAQWIAHGLDCLIVRNQSGGNLCGYVGIPESHPLFGVGYSEPSPVLANALEVRKEQPIGESPGMAIMLAALFGSGLTPQPDIVFQVHGGLTFSDRCRAGEDGDESRYVCHSARNAANEVVFWYGFDCAHAGDVSPGYSRDWPKIGDEVYRDFDYVKQQTESLAAQLASIKGVSNG